MRTQVDVVELPSGLSLADRLRARRVSAAMYRRHCLRCHVEAVVLSRMVRYGV